MKKSNSGMRRRCSGARVRGLAGSGQAAPKDQTRSDKPAPGFSWSTVVNNTDVMPTKGCEEDNTNAGCSTATTSPR